MCGMCGEGQNMEGCVGERFGFIVEGGRLTLNCIHILSEVKGLCLGKNHPVMLLHFKEILRIFSHQPQKYILLYINKCYMFRPCL